MSAAARELWELVEPLLPPRRYDPRGGRPRTIPDRNCLAGIISMTRACIPWELLPAGALGCGTSATCWRRFDAWTQAGVSDRLHLVLLDRLGTQGRVAWSRLLVDTASLRAKRGDHTGANPVDRASRGESRTWPPTRLGCR
jgi:transposase